MKSELRNFILKVLLIIAVGYILCTKVFYISINHENNMYPAIRDGDLCIALRFVTPENGSVVAYNTEEGVKYGRIVSTGGHTVNITNEGLLVDDSLQYEYVVYPTTEEGVEVEMPYNVGEGSYFILNDYRSDTKDSRLYGSLKEEVIGKVVLVIRRRGI